jgi:UDP-N-acetylmuramyl pentapeptide synthase
VGSVEAIARGKSEIFVGLREGGVAVYPIADARLAANAAACARAITFGTRPDAHVQIHSVTAAGAQGSELIVKVDGRPIQFTLPLVGRHNADNAACALAVAVALGVDAELAAQGLETSRPHSMRSEVVDVAGRSVLVDCYNANPASMGAAIETLGQLRGTGSGVAVLGDMLELGDEAEQAHRAAGRQAADAGLEVIALGEFAGHIAAGAREAGGNSRAVDSPEAAAEAVLSATCPGDWILVKASRRMRLERVVEAMKNSRDRRGAR